MPFISVTRLRVRAGRFLPGFFYHTWRSARQVRRAPGFLEGQLAGGPNHTYWTITLWDSEAAMRAYRNSGAHMRAMPNLLDWCDEAAVAHGEQRERVLPSLADAARMIAEEGRLSKVRNPSAAHTAGQRWPDKSVPRGGLRLLPFGVRNR